MKKLIELIKKYLESIEVMPEHDFDQGRFYA